MYVLRIVLCVHNTIVVHSTALNSSDNLRCYNPPDNHHSSDDVCWKRGSDGQLGEWKNPITSESTGWHL